MRVTYLAAAGVEVGVIHGDVGSVGGILVYKRVSTVAAVCPQPASVRLFEFGAIILRAADHEFAVQGMQRQALELRGAEPGGVAAGPGTAAVTRAPNTSIIAFIHDRKVGRGKDDNMSVGVQCGNGRGKSVAAIDRFLQAEASGLASQEEGVGVVGL